MGEAVAVAGVVRVSIRVGGCFSLRLATSKRAANQVGARDLRDSVYERRHKLRRVHFASSKGLQVVGRSVMVTGKSMQQIDQPETPSCDLRGSVTTSAEESFSAEMINSPASSLHWTLKSSNRFTASASRSS
jgi:hypothetical protein